MNLLRMLRAAYTASIDQDLTEESIRSDITLKTVIAVLLSAASALLTILNVVNQYWFMASTTIFLTVGFAFCAILSGLFHQRLASKVIMAVLVALIFSVYAVTAGNEGFAILWILLVPPIGMGLLGLRTGTVLSAYFQFFLIVLFYTPLREQVGDAYTHTFAVRFPILYLTCFAAAAVVTAQKDFYFRKTETMSFEDSLTGVKNRRYYELSKQKVVDAGRLNELTLISIDINRLKYTNDTFGHRAGDRLIVLAAAHMQDSFPDAQAVCRVGGDEFMVVTLAPEETVRQQVCTLLEACKNTCDEEFGQVSLSVGVASESADAPEDIEALARRADSNMYASKSEFYISSHLDRRR